MTKQESRIYDSDQPPCASTRYRQLSRSYARQSVDRPNHPPAGDGRCVDALRLILTSLLLSAITPMTAFAQRDAVYNRAGERTSGELTSVTPAGVEIESGGSSETIAADQILKIMFEGDPPELTRGREFAIDGQYDQAIEELKKIDMNDIDRKLVAADAVFYAALSEAKLALAGKGDKAAAARQVLGFASKYRQSWHFFDAAKLLGDLALALGDTEKALQYYGSLSRAPSTDTKLESVYLKGRVHLKSGDAEAALAEFDKMLGVNAQTARGNRLQALATAGKAAALAAAGKPDESLTLLEPLIAAFDGTDLELAARIYNARGKCYEAKQDAEGAILGYLHTHLMFSSLPDAHAESLQRLIELWPQVGKPEEAARARQELQQRYPGY